MCGGRTTPGRPHPGSQQPRETAARARAECRQAKLGRNCLEKSLAGSSSSQGLGSAQHNASWRHFVLAFVSSDLCPQPLRSCRCPGAAAGEGEEAGNYSALIYDNIIHRLNVCELVKSGFSVSIRARAGTWDSRLGSMTMTMSCSRGALIINHPQLDDV